MDEVLGLAVMLSLPGYVVLQWYAARNWDGGWRMAGLAPLLSMAPRVVRAAFAFMAESNLWPLMVIVPAPLACFYLLALAGARAMADVTVGRQARNLVSGRAFGCGVRLANVGPPFPFLTRYSSRAIPAG